MKHPSMYKIRWLKCDKLKHAYRVMFMVIGLLTMGLVFSIPQVNKVIQSIAIIGIIFGIMSLVVLGYGLGKLDATVLDFARVDKDIASKYKINKKNH